MKKFITVSLLLVAAMGSSMAFGAGGTVTYNADTQYGNVGTKGMSYSLSVSIMQAGVIQQTLPLLAPKQYSNSANLGFTPNSNPYYIQVVIAQHETTAGASSTTYCLNSGVNLSGSQNNNLPTIPFWSNGQPGGSIAGWNSGPCH